MNEPQPSIVERFSGVDLQTQCGIAIDQEILEGISAEQEEQLFGLLDRNEKERPHVFLQTAGIQYPSEWGDDERTVLDILIYQRGQRKKDPEISVQFAQSNLFTSLDSLDKKAAAGRVLEYVLNKSRYIPDSEGVGYGSRY